MSYAKRLVRQTILGSGTWLQFYNQHVKSIPLVSFDTSTRFLFRQRVSKYTSGIDLTLCVWISIIFTRNKNRLPNKFLSAYGRLAHSIRAGPESLSRWTTRWDDPDANHDINMMITWSWSHVWGHKVMSKSCFHVNVMIGCHVWCYKHDVMIDWSWINALNACYEHDL